MKLSIGISENELRKSAAILSLVLADEMVLYIKTRNFHWNVSGESFMELHKLFQAQYTALEETIDEVAERIGKLGEPTPGSMKEFVKLARLPESLGKSSSKKQMIHQLLADHEAMAAQLRRDIDKCSINNKDAGTVDFLTGILQQHETTAWILRRYTA